MANAMWHVRYVDKTVPYYQERLLSLMSRDSANPRKAHKLARDEAKKRLTKKLGRGKFTVLSSECVG